MTNQYFASFGETLKAYRKQQKVTQRQLADRLGVHYNTIWAWERGDYLPNTRNMVLEVAMHLHLDESQTRRLLDASLMDFPLYWSIPYQRNPCFTGREELLLWLHEVFIQKNQACLTSSCVLCGLGGIGKTQVAIEYAYRYSLKHAAILWINASTAETMSNSLMVIAHTLQLFKGDRQDHAQIVAAIAHWLNQHHNWLLIRSEERRVGKECRSLCDWSSDVCSSDLYRAHVATFQRRSTRSRADRGRHCSLAQSAS